MTRGWVVTVEMRPWTHNAERRMHHHERAALVRMWRDATRVLAIRAQVPRGLDRVEIEFRARYATARSLPDVTGIIPAAKAMVDGLVDAGVIADDDPAHVVSVTFLAPVVVRGECDALAMGVRPSAPPR